MMRLGSKSFAILALLAGGCAPAPGGDARAEVQGAEEVRNVILMIADGAGVGHWSAAELASDSLAVESMPVVGLVATKSLQRVTDSAAGASVYATGTRVTNRTISMGPDCPLPSPRDTVVAPESPGCERLETWFEAARERGMAAGVVTTTSVVDATPAAMVAHSPSRYRTEQIAEQFAEAGLDVILGGGRERFEGSTREDGRDLLGEMCREAACVSDAAELAAHMPDDRPLVGLFAAVDMAPAGERAPTLPGMVEAALAKLGRDPEGFVALFETEATDTEAHRNRPLPVIEAEMLEFDRAVGVALDFARSNPGTLLVVTSDHETGGLSLPEGGDTASVEYTTGGHTGALVPLFAYGPGAKRFAGLLQNYEVGRMLMEIVAR